MFLLEANVSVDLCYPVVYYSWVDHDWLQCMCVCLAIGLPVVYRMTLAAVNIADR